MEFRTGDLIGVTSIWGNAIWNFFRLLVLRDWAYARKNWRKIRVPTKFYIVCEARRNGLLYALKAKKKRGANIVFRALNKIGKIVWAGRSNVYDSLSNQMRLNEGISALHYDVTTGEHEYGWYKKGKILNNRFIIDVITFEGIKFNLKALYENRDCTTLYLIESGNFNGCLPVERG